MMNMKTEEKKSVMSCIDEICVDINNAIDLWIEWKKAKRWAKVFHPAWVRFASQRNRPEIRTTYRNKILNAYRNAYH